jgi:hypothetical protein
MPDNSRLTAKQYSFRLPVHVAAKLAALCELYPNKTRTQIVADLMATAIDLAVEGLPSIKGRKLDQIPTDDGTWLNIFDDVGPAGRYKRLANKHFAELERELGNAEPGLAYEYNYVFRDANELVQAFTTGEEAER